MASTLVRWIDSHAMISASPTPRKTTKRCRAHASMMRATMSVALVPGRGGRRGGRRSGRGRSLDLRLQAALGVEEEVAGGDHQLALGDAAGQELDPALDAAPD